MLAHSEYGIYVACIIDGDSRMVLSLVAMQTKSAYWVYKLVLLPFLYIWGFPDQLVTDHGEEWCLSAFVCLFVQSLTGWARRAGRLAARATTSTRNQRVERFNRDLNVRNLIPVRMLVNHLQLRQLISRSDPRTLFAFSSLVLPLLQVGLDRHRAAHNEHDVRAVRGRPGSGGRPSVRAQRRPHPGPRLTAPTGFDPQRDPIAAWQAAGRTPLPQDAPATSLHADALHGQPMRQAARALAMKQLMPDPAAAWEELLAGNFVRFENAYIIWMQCR